MKVSTAKPFQIIYSLFQHEYLGYLFESFVVQLDDNNRLTLQNQNISSQNAPEFASGLDEKDYQLITLMDSMQQNAVIRHFNRKLIKPSEYFPRLYANREANKLLIEQIDQYLEKRRSKILSLMVPDKMLFEMGNDGEPTWHQVNIMPEAASVLFHFRRNDDNTHYFPTIKYDQEKLDFQYKGSYIICRQPAWMITNGNLYHFKKDVDGNKLMPFLNKRFIEIPRKVEETYFKRFVSSLVASFDVYAVGFEIKTEKYQAQPVLNFNFLKASRVMTLFDGGEDEEPETKIDKVVFDLNFIYGPHTFSADSKVPVNVVMLKKGDSYTFFRIVRKLDFEKKIIAFFKAKGLHLKYNKVTIDKIKAFQWLHHHRDDLLAMGIEVRQPSDAEKRYFLGESSISVTITEKIDWFDINAIVKFGPYEIPFAELRKRIIRQSNEILLPNGEIAVIPQEWTEKYAELFAFLEEQKDHKRSLVLRKHHLALVYELESEKLADVSIDRKLERLKEFREIEDYPIPNCFKGHLRPYQKAGFNWLQFLNKYNFGGCLADDMGLGKTVQTLALLLDQKEKGINTASLLIMPTSLIYNWEMEANKFTPDLKIFTYTGTSRIKDVGQFEGYDLVLTSYGITRLDIDILKEYKFNYVILDESQAIKNPTSNISKAVKKLHSCFKLILTGTPLENSTLDLWSQMTFINPGLLGTQKFFRNAFLNPIEKEKDDKKSQKLYSIIKPFIMRRHKSQVASELPEKIIKVHYSGMTAMQEEKYNEAKSYYRNKILDHIEARGMRNSQFILLQGLTKLRQLANHPKMMDEDYKGDSGKMEDTIYMLNNAIGDNHKVLIFSQFVKHLSLLRDYLDLKGFRYSYLDGSTRDRKTQVEQFQNDEKIRLFLISLKAGGLGLNLTKADYVFILDPWWNPAIETQAEDRAHRIGQLNRVFTYKFITKNTVEEKILSLQQRKLNLAQKLISTEESFVKELSKDDIESLLT